MARLSRLIMSIELFKISFKFLPEPVTTQPNRLIVNVNHHVNLSSI